MRRPQMEQYAAFLQIPHPNGRKMKMNMKRGKNARVTAAEANMSTRRRKAALGIFLVTGTMVLQ